jgi:hypothetical protein
MIQVWHEFTHPFHLALATPGWIEKLSEFIGAHVALNPEFSTRRGEALVRSRYGEDRYMGPLSLCRYFFEVKARIERADGSEPKDFLEAGVEYDPRNCAFRLSGRPLIRTLEIEERERRIEELFGGWAWRIRAGAPQEEVGAWRCPRCDAPMIVEFTSEGKCFRVKCMSELCDLVRYFATETVPSWWRERVSGDLILFR